MRGCKQSNWNPFYNISLKQEIRKFAYNLHLQSAILEVSHPDIYI